MNMADREDDDPLQAFVRGRLPDAEAERLGSDLAWDPHLAAEHRLVEALNHVDPAPHPFPGAFGWARLSRAIDEERPAQERPKALWRRQVPVWQAAACILVVVLALPVGSQWLTNTPDSARFVPATGPTTAQPGASETPVQQASATVRIVFAPTATAQAISDALQATDATIVDGPSAIGFFTLAFATDDALAAALPQFADMPAVIELIDPQ